MPPGYSQLGSGSGEREVERLEAAEPSSPRGPAAIASRISIAMIAKPPGRAPGSRP